MKPLRAKQTLPQDVISALMTAVRQYFYRDVPDKQWFQDRTFILRHVITWPAAWLNNRGVTLSPERYQAIVMNVLVEIRNNRTDQVVQYWPGYLKHCLQAHFRHHGEEYYEEAKSLRAALEHAQMAIGRARVASQTADPVRAIAEAHRILKAAQRQRRRPETPAKQPDLFNL